MRSRTEERIRSEVAARAGLKAERIRRSQVVVSASANLAQATGAEPALGRFMPRDGRIDVPEGAGLGDGLISWYQTA